MIKLLSLALLPLLGACTTIQPCFNYGTISTANQVGIILYDGQKDFTGYTCPETINSDLLDPPLPFDDNLAWDI